MHDYSKVLVAYSLVVFTAGAIVGAAVGVIVGLMI
jgi:hypothetical protein